MAETGKLRSLIVEYKCIHVYHEGCSTMALHTIAGIKERAGKTKAGAYSYGQTIPYWRNTGQMKGEWPDRVHVLHIEVYDIDLDAVKRALAAYSIDRTNEDLTQGK